MCSRDMDSASIKINSVTKEGSIDSIELMLEWVYIKTNQDTLHAHHSIRKEL
jgi:hypothetical protein